uniref:Capsid protein n=1 Tax=Rosellinia necatrix partitivirus 25 TaxID=2699393 RepID=A0A6F8QGQ2_9VIRU|nr:capsid protein [Rosellinia necatrix partitivirus 25]
MSSLANKLSNNAQKVKKFSTNITFNEVKTPVPTDDFVARFRANTAARLDSANEFIINVLPNMVTILCFILFHVNQLVPALEASKHAKISAATFTAYCLAIVYAHIFANDAYVRPVPSQHAYEWLNNAKKNDFIEFMLTLPVPEFLEPLLTKLTATSTERRANVAFVPSPAGFFYSMHFGRIFPIAMFTHLHDVAAEMPSNSSPSATMSDYFLRPLYTITTLMTGVTNFSASSAHFLGTWFLSGGTAAASQSSYGSKLEQLFQSVFNPVLFRDYQRRSTLASIALAAPTFADRFMNFYDFVFSCSSRTATMNLAELKVVFQSIASAMNGNIPTKKDLATFISSSTGIEILDHGYSVSRLPTFHHSRTFPVTMTTRPARVSAEDFSSAIRFLRTPTEANMPTRIDYPTITGTCQTDRQHRVTLSNFTNPFNRIHSDNSGQQVPRFSDFITFSEDTHVYPKVYVMSIGSSTVDAWKSTAFGFVIETNDLDGTVIPVPNTELNLGIENTWFADSAIPVRYCFWQISFDVQATTSFAFALKRTIAPRQTRFPAASLIADRLKINLPRMNARGATLTNNNPFVGLTQVDRVNWPQMVQSFFGFRTADRRSRSTNDDQIPDLANGRFLVWSPYTYVGVEGENDYESAIC